MGPFLWADPGEPGGSKGQGVSLMGGSLGLQGPQQGPLGYCLLKSSSPGFYLVTNPSLLLSWMLVPGPLLQMKKGNTMQQFLQKALEILRKDFSELRCATAQSSGAESSGVQSSRAPAQGCGARVYAFESGAQRPRCRSP